ncbi:PIN domain-containing protein [Streptomyces hydrogenans]|uniref:PIN domain-containing protein n=1 Tax=Streptomyces hydrogenans TaxID=1873719 RepID=UPI00367ED58D
MIIFDTNAIKDLDPHGSKADLIRLLRKADVKVAAPWVVLEELSAHKLYQYQRHFDLMRRQHQALAALEPNLAGPEPKFEGDRFAQHWRKQYSEIFTVLPTSSRALKAAVLREAACMKPAKVDTTKKSGGRDVAIWFSILEYLDENPHEEIFFVTSNTADFGEPDEWPFPLDIDLKDKAHRLTQLLDFEEALKRFTEEADTPDGIEKELKTRLSASESMKIVTAEARRKYGVSRKSGDAATGVRVALDSLNVGGARRVGDSLWYWARATWQTYLLSHRVNPPLVASWDTSILFPESREQPVSILRSGRLTPLSASDLNTKMQESLAVDQVVLEEEELIRGSQLHEEESVEDIQDQISTSQRILRKHRQSHRTDGSALQYTYLVLDLLRNLTGRRVVPVDGPLSLSLDAILETPEGNIGVAVKAGSGQLSFRDIEDAKLAPSALVESLLVVTSRNFTSASREAVYLAQQGNGRPLEVVRWVGTEDDLVEEKIHRLRQRMITF